VGRLFIGSRHRDHRIITTAQIGDRTPAGGEDAGISKSTLHDDVSGKPDKKRETTTKAERRAQREAESRQTTGTAQKG
jgi:hypothetical protein